MAEMRLGIIMNGGTGRMGTNQHLVRSILTIQAERGVSLDNGNWVMPDPILVGRNQAKVEALAKAHGVARWTTDLDAPLANPDDTVFFDTISTGLRAGLINPAVAPSNHAYVEKLTTETLKGALEAAASTALAADGAPGHSCLSPVSCPDRAVVSPPYLQSAGTVLYDWCGLYRLSERPPGLYHDDWRPELRPFGGASKRAFPAHRQSQAATGPGSGKPTRRNGDGAIWHSLTSFRDRRTST